MTKAISNQQSAISKRNVCWLLAAGCWLLSTGCIHRSLTISSEPEGAQILMNDKQLGATPHTYDFLWYGNYRLTLTKPGYERLDDHVLLKAPVYLWIPCDLVMELLPFPVRDTKVRTYRLSPKQPLPEPTPPVISTPPPQPSPPTTQETGNGQTR